MADVLWTLLPVFVTLLVICILLWHETYRMRGIIRKFRTIIADRIGQTIDLREEVIEQRGQIEDLQSRLDDARGERDALLANQHEADIALLNQLFGNEAVKPQA